MMMISYETLKNIKCTEFVLAQEDVDCRSWKLSWVSNEFIKWYVLSDTSVNSQTWWSARISSDITQLSKVEAWNKKIPMNFDWKMNFHRIYYVSSSLILYENSRCYRPASFRRFAFPPSQLSIKEMKEKILQNCFCLRNKSGNKISLSFLSLSLSLIQPTWQMPLRCFVLFSCFSLS